MLSRKMSRKLQRVEETETVKWQQWTFGVLILAFALAIWYRSSQKPVEEYPYYGALGDDL